MIEAETMIVKEWTRQVAATTKENQQDVLANELLRERAAVLARAGFAVENALDKLQKIEKQINDKMQHLQSAGDGLCTGLPVLEHAVSEEINLLIEDFNTARKKAEIQFYYLIVTREAMGLRRHETVNRLYSIPPKKQMMKAV